MALARPGNKRLVLVAMIFAVAMTFIDQTIVAIAVPELQKDLSLSSTGVQWVVNGYLLALSAMFAFGGRLADIAGHRRMVVIGVVGFAVASGLCGATPSGDLAEAWIIFWRVVQGAAAALMFPAALAIVVASFPVSERGLSALLAALLAVLQQGRFECADAGERVRERDVAAVLELGERFEPVGGAGVPGDEDQLARLRARC